MNAANQRLYKTLLGNLEAGVCPVHVAEHRVAEYRRTACCDDATIDYLSGLDQTPSTIDAIAFVQRSQARILAKAEATEQAISAYHASRLLSSWTQ